MPNTDIKINAHQIAGLESLKFEYVHVPSGLPTNHPARQFYDDRVHQDTIDPGTDTHWVLCKNGQGLPVAHAEIGTVNGKLTCLNVYVEPICRRRDVATTMYDLVEHETGRMITPSNTMTQDADAFWSARRRRA